MTEPSNFDKKAATWDEEPRRVELAREVADAILTAAQPTAAMDALDFGCGTGLLTLFLQPHLRSIAGVDSSRGMFDVLANKIRALGLANVRAQLCDVERGERPAGQYHLIVSSMALHHVAELLPLFRLFADLLLPGGILCLADLDKEDGTFHDDPTGVHHFGFERPLVRGLLAKAGFTDCRDTTAAVIRKETRDFPVFLISARKPT
jgi:cyclopropane fatty-acyl-phospholipid synthase-like methyltransferase